MKKLVVKYNNGRSIVIPDPDEINIKFNDSNVKPYNFKLNCKRHDLRNLDAVFKKLKKGV